VKKYANWYFGWIKFIEKKFYISFYSKKVFEIGSGAGGVCYLLNQLGANIVGSDISRMMVKKAKRNISSVPFVYCDIQKKIPSRIKYDYIMGFEVLEHLNNPTKGIVNIYKALKTKGMFIGSTPYPFPKNLIDPTHVNVKYPEQWKKLFIDSGFKNVICQPLSFLPLLWRINRSLNISLPFYVSLPGFVSTTLLVAER